MKDYYKVLGINEGATIKEIKKAYRDLAKIHHPDVGGDEGLMIAIIEAYEILSNEITRKEYDNYRDLYANAKKDDEYEPAIKTFYWQAYETFTDNAERIWELFMAKVNSKPSFDNITEFMINKNCKEVIRVIKYFYKVPKDQLKVLEKDVFPLFIRGGIILADILKEETPNYEYYWKKYYNTFLSLFNVEPPFDFLMRKDSKEVEKIFPEEFNMIGKRYFESIINNTAFNTHNMGSEEYKILTLLSASLFLRGYHTSNANHGLKKIEDSGRVIKYVSKSVVFLIRNWKRIVYTVFGGILLFDLILLIVVFASQ
ncbi:DnaJ domain-containing protein [Neobacillus sp. CF12]|uniref:J domain-containing protein n=1 Tax=Neobacillus sp. CF12 TaxID=3055864 RepID=UPI0025A1D5AA|nr:DnaJ domain-containing protein [Neobacillus sp. CF12]MDM5329847.1 DnaJ domain-containing protein [Neobacillus sp. CF12]